MKNIVRLITFCFITLSLLSSCTKKESANTMILFVEKENTLDPYQTRMIINDQFVRIDDGKGSNSFVLFDRIKKVVYSTIPDEQRVMAVHEKKLKKDQVFEPPFALKHSVKKMPEMKKAPKINGENAQHYQLITNDKVCYEVVAIKNLMPHAVKALIEFNKHMATDSIVTFNNMPADLHEACDMTATTFKPARQFEFGFPVQEWSQRGYSRSLVDFDVNFKAEPKLFELPKGYHNYTVTQLREGNVKFK